MRPLTGSKADNLSLNIKKTKELIIDYRKKQDTHTTTHQRGDGGESVQLQILGQTHLRELIMGNKHNSNSKESTAAVILSPHTQESQYLTTAPKVLLSLLHRECAHLRNSVVVR